MGVRPYCWYRTREDAAQSTFYGYSRIRDLYRSIDLSFSRHLLFSQKYKIDRQMFDSKELCRVGLNDVLSFTPLDSIYIYIRTTHGSNSQHASQPHIHSFVLHTRTSHAGVLLNVRAGKKSKDCVSGTVHTTSRRFFFSWVLNRSTPVKKSTLSNHEA